MPNTSTIVPMAISEGWIIAPSRFYLFLQLLSLVAPSLQRVAPLGEPHSTPKVPDSAASRPNPRVCFDFPSGRR